MGRFRRTVPRSRVPLHRRIRLHPAALRYWLLVLAGALVLSSVVGHAVSRATQAEAAWGRTRTVWVTVAPLAAGDPASGSVRARRWPTALVPPRALTTRPGSGARAAAAIDAGTALTASLIQDVGGSADRRTVAVPLPDAHLSVERGDRVDVWATADPATVADGEVATHRVAVDAQVLEQGDRSAVLAVSPKDVTALTDAAATATISLVGRW